MYKARCRLYYKANNPKPKHKSAIEKSDKLLINAYFNDASSDPKKLQEYVWFTLCLQFGRRGREGWRAMQKDYFVADTDSDGKRFVGTLSTESTKNIQGGNKQSDQDYSDTRMYELSGSRLCPVQAYEMYISKLHPDNQALFAKPKNNFSLDSSIWYTREVLGKNTINDMMKNISKKAGCGKIYTNHCVRATTVTSLYQAGVDAQTICSITKHKSENTLKHYIDSRTDQQKQHASRVLSAAMIQDNGSQVIHSSQISECHPSSQPAGSEVAMSTGNSNEMGNLANIFANATFQNCVININR